jgi:AcrR family transcriptional regulator
VGSQERRHRVRTGTRSLILDAARERFVRLGYEATSMRAIAEAVEYTPAALYHHFESKEDLFHQLVHEDFEALTREFKAIGALDDPLRRIVETGQAYVAFARKHPMHYRLMFMTAGPAPGVGAEPDMSEPRCRVADPADPVDGAYGFLRDAVAHALERNQFRPELTDPDLVAQLLWGGLHGLIALHIAKGDDPHVPFVPLESACESMQTALLRGLLRDPRPAPLEPFCA